MVAYFIDWLLKSPYFFITWATFLGAGLIGFSIRLFNRDSDRSLGAFVRYCFPPEIWISRSARTDILLWMLLKLQDLLLRELPAIASVSAVAVLFSSYLRQLSGHFEPLPATGFAVAVSVASLFVLKEFIDYSIHFLQHRIPVLWELHKVHHSALQLIPFTAKRGHPLEVLISGIVSGVGMGLAFGVCGFLFGFDLPELALSAAALNKVMTIGSFDTLRHSHFAFSFGWLDRVFISPHMHHIHHSSLPHHWDKNFGTNLSIFDWIFGTAYKPSKNENIAYGIGDDDEERAHFTLAGALVSPLLKMSRLIGRRRVVEETKQQAQPVAAAGQ